MTRLSERKIVLITRSTRLDELVVRYNTIEQARFYVEHLGSDFTDYIVEDANYKSALRQVEAAIESAGRLQTVNRVHIANFIFGKEDIVVALGQDGLVANTLKYLEGQPLIGVNPDPHRWDGILLPFMVNNVSAILSEVINSNRNYKEITMVKAVLNDGQSLFAVNDLFIGQRSHVSARYNISVSGTAENQSSSGIIVSTGLGSTGWLSSIIAGAAKISGVSNSTNHGMSWDSDYLTYSVREPFPSKSTGTSLVFGIINKKSPMTVTSQMPENGVIFSDGMENDALLFPSGITATITVADKKGILIV